MRRMERLGLVGLPNAGKTSLFNALTGADAPVAAHPFTTTETSVAVAPIPDARLDKLAAKSTTHLGDLLEKNWIKGRQNSRSASRRNQRAGCCSGRQF